jgi:hypothetical protein
MLSMRKTTRLPASKALLFAAFFFLDDEAVDGTQSPNTVVPA